MIIKRAIKDTFEGQLTALYFLVFGGLFGLVYLYFREGQKLALDEIIFYEAAIAGAVLALVLFFVGNLCAAPFRIERDKRIALEAQLADLKQLATSSSFFDHGKIFEAVEIDFNKAMHHQIFAESSVKISMRWPDTHGHHSGSLQIYHTDNASIVFPKEVQFLSEDGLAPVLSSNPLVVHLSTTSGGSKVLAWSVTKPPTDVIS